MKILAEFRKRQHYLLPIALTIIAVILLFWRPHVLISGVQRGSLYGLTALPLALILGIVGILNLAHGEFLMLGAFFTYWLVTSFGIDPLMALGPAFLALFLFGIFTYKVTIKHVLKAPRLNQFLLTFGLALVLAETVNLVFSPRTRIIHVPYAAMSATIGDITFGTFEFIYVAAAIIVVVGLLFFLTRTRTGQAALAVGQNPRGAKLVGINVDRTYLVIFSISIALMGAIGALFVIRHAIFPMVGGPFTMRSFALVAMAGFGNLPAIFKWGIALGVAEAFVKSFKGWGGWAELIFFAMIIIVIIVRSYRRQVT